MSGQSPVSPARKLHDADVVYLYDGSFEGFLCCVFESFAQHELPFAVWTPERETATLYPVKEIPTDHAKVFCFALNLLAHGFQPHSSNIPPGHRSESNPHSPADRCR